MDTTPYAYFWRNNEVLVIRESPYTSRVRLLGYMDLPCVDMTADLEHLRYGKFTEAKSWVAIPYSEFPKEFLTALLLI